MAIIIGAVILIIIAVCGYIRYNANNMRKKERNFYDIFFVIIFIQYLKKNRKMHLFVRPGVTINVSRRMVFLKRISDLNAQNNSIESIYDLRKINQTDEKKKMISCIIYEFILDDKKIAFCAIINHFYNNLFRQINNTYFSLNIDSTKIKMIPIDSFKGKIYLNSNTSIFQSLKLIFQSEEQQLNDSFSRFFCGVETLVETDTIIDYLKTFFYNY